MSRNTFDVGESAPSKPANRSAWRGPTAVEWVGGWFAVFSAVLLANLLAVVILFLVTKAFVEKQIRELDRPTTQERK